MSPRVCGLTSEKRQDGCICVSGGGCVSASSDPLVGMVNDQGSGDAVREVVPEEALTKRERSDGRVTSLCVQRALGGKIGLA